MGAGTNRMNIYNIRRATTALALHVRETFGSEGPLKVGISYDSRNFSREFAFAAAEVLAANGIKALITEELRPTPMLSFMVRHFGCAAGICITASHNPPEYNGYKVYWSSGAQIIAPHDAAIIAKYSHLEKFEDIKSMPIDHAKSQGLCQLVGRDLDEVLHKCASRVCSCKKRCALAVTDL
jgi:phosphomannomutase